MQAAIAALLVALLSTSSSAAQSVLASKVDKCGFDRQRALDANCLDRELFCKYWKEQGFCAKGHLLANFLSEKCPATCERETCKTISWGLVACPIFNNDDKSIRYTWTSTPDVYSPGALFAHHGGPQSFATLDLAQRECRALNVKIKTESGDVNAANGCNAVTHVPTTGKFELRRKGKNGLRKKTGLITYTFTEKSAVPTLTTPASTTTITTVPATTTPEPSTASAAEPARHYAVVGSTKSTKQPWCSVAGPNGGAPPTANVRCCADAADAAAPAHASTKTCEELGWASNKASGFGSTDVCGDTPKMQLPRGRKGCPAARTFEDARKHCAAVGARLCTQAEVERDETRGTGCNYDLEHVWTSTPCSGSVI